MAASSPASSRHVPSILLVQILLGAASVARADDGATLEGRIAVPYVSGRPGTHAFTGHPGWVDAYPAGHGEGVSARVGDDATFRLPRSPSGKPLHLIVQLDRFETPPFVVTVPPGADRLAALIDAIQVAAEERRAEARSGPGPR